jgi:hypothetical protein
VQTIRPDGIDAMQSAHAFVQVRIRRLHDEMEMVRHQAICMHLGSSFQAGLGKRLDEVLAIDIIEENILPPISSAHHVINGTGVLVWRCEIIRGDSDQTAAD